MEFPIDSYRWFNDLGNQSTLDFEHPLHTLESKDLNLEITKTCIADKYKTDCMSNEILFGDTHRRNIFIGPRAKHTCRNEHELEDN